MNDNKINLIAGSIQGSIRTLIVYPFDYLRINYISGKYSSLKNTFNNELKNIYKGVSYSIFINSIARSINFMIYEYYKKKNKLFEASLIASSVSNFVINPLNIIITNYINSNKKNIIDIFIKNKNTNLFRGILVENFRGTLSGFIFLYSYGYLNNMKEKNTSNYFINAGLAGNFSWLLLYSLDYIKIHKYLYNNSLYNIFKNYKDFYKGFILIIPRNFISYGSSMYIYELTKNKLKNYN